MGTIVFFLIVVDRAIDFDHKTILGAVKVHDKWTDGLLPTELRVDRTTLTKRLPECLFTGRWRLRVSTRMCRLRPITFFPPSKPRSLPASVVLTPSLSMIPALGSGLAPRLAERAGVACHVLAALIVQHRLLL